VLDFVTAYRANLTTRTTLFDGAREVLDRLSGENRLLGLCSNKQHELTVEILQQLDLARYFSAVIGEGIGFARKPDPEPLNAVLAKLGARPEDAVMVGDSAADVECARAAGVIPVAVTFGYSKVAPEELGARAVVSHFNALHECFATLGPE
jgi:phosphoglycolate phosphatase